MTDLDRYRENESINLLLEEAGLKGSKREERYPGKKFFGYFCSYWPEELVLAAGMEPVRLFPDSANANPVELPTYCCSLARGTLAKGLRGDYSDLGGVGFAHTCDTMQCLSGIWNQRLGGEFTIVPPVMLGNAGARKYYRAELSGVLNSLAGVSKKTIGEKEIAESVALCRKARGLVNELEGLRPFLPSDLVSAILRAGQVMPRSEFVKALENAMPVLKESNKEKAAKEGILVSGAVLENDSLFGMVEELGGRVVADDTCTGYHHYTDVPDEGDPLDQIVERYSGMPPCPCRNKGLDARTGYLEGLAKEREAKGAVLVIRKYCEPHAWDAVPVSERLRAAGIKTLVLELEGADVGGQERTRLQAFLESL